ncbi:hypothetical protein I302_107158 [Kwoniella bestiolae CBS 10118]|uniref:Uncharacterized protein n=1 Tax=Kwoniella bestiolae CBS 10118 TaxID=1296100 RepID=A0A1B9FZB7_9TREE|nr:hypothetical protein I302_05575 [Kwoniella bestiolae CBS 10118]OCF24117.1 hypothetical protein I302_05575 [Kwoniella bestiolae CBS 10118]
MSSLPLLLLFLLTLPIPPLIPLRQIRLDAFLMPLSLPFIPSSTFTSLPDSRPWDISRSIVRLIIAYSLFAGFGSLLRTLKRIGGWKIPTSSSNQLFRVGLLWILAWRTATLPFIPDEKAWRRPLDVATIIGVGSGGICVISEVREILRLIGVRDAQQYPKSGIISRIIQIILSIHRILLSLRIISAAFAPASPIPINISNMGEGTVGQ